MRIGPYEILGELGRGGMGVVYRARHTVLGREVALKVCDAEDAGLRARFRREAQAAARLAGHPNIVAVHDVGEAVVDAQLSVQSSELRVADAPRSTLNPQLSTAQPVLYLAMDLIEGRTLAAALDEGPLAPETVAAIGEGIARGLAHAHAHGVIHRDVKPANVLLDREGRPRLADFGLARAVDTAPGLTRTDMLVGTPSYMAPEQARGEPADPRTDVWAAGAVLLELLTGGPPFDDSEPAAVLARVLRDTPPGPRDRDATIPADLDAIVRGCLARDPADRYASADALAEDLARFRRGEPPLRRRPGPLTRVARRIRRRPARAVAAVAIAGSVALAVGLAAGGSRRTREAHADAEAATEGRSEAERAARSSAAYAALAQATVADLRILEDRFHGAAHSADDVAAALARVRSAAAGVAATDPATAVPRALVALAVVLAGAPEAEAAIAAVGPAADDPLAGALVARTHLAAYTRRIQLPPVSVGAGSIRVAALEEPADLAARRAAAVGALAPLRAAPAWRTGAAASALATYADGAVALAEARYEAADTALARLEDDPLLSGEAGMLQGLARYLSGDPLAAAAAWERVGARGWPRPLVNAGIALASQGSVLAARGEDPLPVLERALRAYTGALDIVPEEARVRADRANAWALLGQSQAERNINPRPALDAARADADAAVAQAPQEFMVRVVRASLYVQIANMAARQGIGQMPDLTVPLADLDMAVTLVPDDPEALGLRGRVRIHLAGERRTAGDPAGALAAAQGAVHDLTTARRLRPADPTHAIGRGYAHVAVAEVRAVSGTDPGPDWAAAEADFRDAIRLAPEVPAARFALGRLFHKRAGSAAGPAAAVRDTEAAIAEYGEGLTRTGWNIAVYLERGLLHWSRAALATRLAEDPEPHLRAAVADFSAVLERQPGVRSARRSRAMVRYQLAVRADAQQRAGVADWLAVAEDLEAVCARLPDDWEAHAYRADALLRAGDPAAAVPCFAAAVRANPDPPAWVRDNLAVARARAAALQQR